MCTLYTVHNNGQKIGVRNADEKGGIEVSFFNSVHKVVMTSYSTALR
jgi:hypothetical protein